LMLDWMTLKSITVMEDGHAFLTQTMVVPGSLREGTIIEW
jgi:hypothetical protein